MDNVKRIVEIVGQFEKQITESRDLVSEAADMIEGLQQKLIQFSAENTGMELADIIERILDDEPDVKLRPRLTRLVEVIRNANGQINADAIIAKIMI